MGALGPTEIIIIFLLFLLLFGAKRIPEMARGLGKGIREFKSATNEISRELTLEDKRQRYQTPPPSHQPPVQQPTAPPPAAASNPATDNAGSSAQP